MNDYNIEYWLNGSDLARIDYSTYWNDEKEERKKSWWISACEDDFSRMERHIDSSGLGSDLETCIESLRSSHSYELHGTGIDLAAGTLWSSPFLLKNGKVNKLYMVDYSKHRLLKIGPLVLSHYQIPRDKIILAMGSFYNVRVGDGSVNFVLLSSAFHHADRPAALLSEINRVLKKDGVVIVIGEPIADFGCISRYIIKYVASRVCPAALQRSIFGKEITVPGLFAKTFEPISKDEVLGDRVYTMSQYNSLFLENGFVYKCLRKAGSLYQSFLLFKK